MTSAGGRAKLLGTASAGIALASSGSRADAEAGLASSREAGCRSGAIGSLRRGTASQRTGPACASGTLADRCLVRLPALVSFFVTDFGSRYRVAQDSSCSCTGTGAAGGTGSRGRALARRGPTRASKEVELFCLSVGWRSILRFLARENRSTTRLVRSASSSARPARGDRDEDGLGSCRRQAR